MENISSILSIISGMLVSIAGIMTALITIIKPLRKHFLNKITRIGTVEKGLQDLNEKLSKKIDTITTTVQNLSIHVATMDKKIDMNEKDRLRDEIFRIGRLARKGEKITSQQFAHLEEDYDKYKILGGNSHAHDEHDFVVDYYNRRGWEQ